MSKEWAISGWVSSCIIQIHDEGNVATSPLVILIISILNELSMEIWPCQITVQAPPDHLRKHGPLVPGWWASPNTGGSVHASDGNLLLDTGASGMMIDEGIAAGLNLPMLDEKKSHGIHGHGTSRRYIATLFLPVLDGSGGNLALGIPVECSAVPQLSERYSRDGLSVVGILGRNFLQFCMLEINGLSGRIVVQIDGSILRSRELGR